ncbi:MAG: hypothetical protein HS111_19735 [Kofleriaceae bacterium]|nr:hypothetical protein [Kofleriaceae bacterium]MCL4225171.1 hypothetical protein [Myxococcales bacterium]
MPIKKEHVAEVVADASKKMSDPNYSAVLVGGFVQRQTPITQFVSAHEPELGGADAIVNVIFHAALIGECFARGNGRSVRIVSFDDLDRASGGDPLALLEKTQPFLHGFIEENVGEGEARRLLALIALAMDR